MGGSLGKNYFFIKDFVFFFVVQTEEICTARTSDSCNCI